VESATKLRQNPSPDVDQAIDVNPFREARTILCTTFGPFDPSKSIAAGNKGICVAAIRDSYGLPKSRLCQDSAHIALPPQCKREQHGGKNPCDHPIFERQRQPQQDQRYPQRPN
jgi:hypothetical protein